MEKETANPQKYSANFKLRVTVQMRIYVQAKNPFAGYGRHYLFLRYDSELPLLML